MIGRANITSIYKKGSQKRPFNYRSVSITSHLCKILESIIRHSILEHLNKNSHYECSRNAKEAAIIVNETDCELAAARLQPRN